MTETKRCAGAPTLGEPSHDAPVSEFGPNRASKDGLYHQCRFHAKMYQAAWRAKKAAGETSTRTEKWTAADQRLADSFEQDEPVGTTEAPLEVVNGDKAAAERQQALEAVVEAVGGTETDAGQAALAQAAEEAAVARRAAAAEARRRQRAAQKAREATA